MAPRSSTSGIEPGDRVAIWAFNSAEWIVAVLGIFQAGAVLVPVNTRFKGVEAADILARSRARALVTVTDFLGTDYLALLEASGVDLPDLETVVVARGSAAGGAHSWGDFLAGRRAMRAPRSMNGEPRSTPTTRPTSSSPRARRACRRAW